jgi:release factor glutamine methyltransferase
MLARGREFLQGKGIEEARLDAELLVAHALGLDRLHLFLELERPVIAGEIDRARDLLVRRGRGEPTGYLTGEREFYGRGFRVGRGVLIPRPETELLVDLARERLVSSTGPRPLRIGEMGTGSGCIAVTLALEFPGSEVIATDLQEDALGFARENARRLEASVRFEPGDGLTPLAPHAPFDLLISNPPYVDPATAATLAREVRDHEPEVALFAPAGDPDHWLRRLLDEGLPLLRPGGSLLVELGFDQGERARALLEERSLPFQLHRDLERIERVAEVSPR